MSSKTRFPISYIEFRARARDSRLPTDEKQMKRAYKLYLKTHSFEVGALSYGFFIIGQYVGLMKENLDDIRIISKSIDKELNRAPPMKR